MTSQSLSVQKNLIDFFFFCQTAAFFLGNISTPEKKSNKKMRTLTIAANRKYTEQKSVHSLCWLFYLYQSECKKKSTHL